MTTTSERCRALRWGAEILNQRQGDPVPDVDLAERAQMLLRTYPTREVIDALNAGKDIKLTLAQIQAINDTSVLLTGLPGLGIEPRSVIEGTLRHFPLPWEGNAGFLFFPPIK